VDTETEIPAVDMVVDHEMMNRENDHMRATDTTKTPASYEDTRGSETSGLSCGGFLEYFLPFINKGKAFFESLFTKVVLPLPAPRLLSTSTSLSVQKLSISHMVIRLHLDSNACITGLVRHRLSGWSFSTRISFVLREGKHLGLTWEVRSEVREEYTV